MNKRLLVVDATPEVCETSGSNICCNWASPLSNETGGLVMATHKAMTAATISSERRCEARVKYRCRCSYEVAEAIDEELAFFEQGEAFALDRSAKGILIVMGYARHVTQLIEVHAFHSRWGRTRNVYEIRWNRPIQVGSFGNLYLVGCRRIFGPVSICRSD